MTVEVGSSSGRPGATWETSEYFPTIEMMQLNSFPVSVLLAPAAVGNFARLFCTGCLWQCSV